MAVFKDYITTTGQRMLAQMLTGEVENLKFTKMVLGDGANKNPEGATEVINPICEVEIESVTLSDKNVLTITASFTNKDITSGFYMREKGLYLSDGEEEILAIYANAGSTAGYVEPAASGLIKKVIRSSVTFSQADIVNVELIDNSYANAVDFEKHEKDKENPHNVTAKQVGLENVPNVQTNDQTPTYEGTETLTELKSGEKLSTAFGKLAKAVKDFISHLSDKVVHITSDERTLWNTVSNKADSNHTHKYAGSSSAGGAANSAKKLSSTRYIDGMPFDGTCNISRLGTCTTASYDTAKEVTISGFEETEDCANAILYIQFTGTYEGGATDTHTISINGGDQLVIYYNGEMLNWETFFSSYPFCDGQIHQFKFYYHPMGSYLELIAVQNRAVANNLTTTNEKIALAAPMGKQLAETDASLQEQISTLNSNMNNTCSLAAGESIAINFRNAYGTGNIAILQIYHQIEGYRALYFVISGGGSGIIADQKAQIIPLLESSVFSIEHNSNHYNSLKITNNYTSSVTVRVVLLSGSFSNFTIS